MLQDDLYVLLEGATNMASEGRGLGAYRPQQVVCYHHQPSEYGGYYLALLPAVELPLGVEGGGIPHSVHSEISYMISFLLLLQREEFSTSEAV